MHFLKIPVVNQLVPKQKQTKVKIYFHPTQTHLPITLMLEMQILATQTQQWLKR